MADMSAGGPKEAGKKTNRIRNMLLCVLCVLAVLLALVCLYCSYTKTHYKTVFYHETSKKVSAGIRIAVISDIHDREYGEKNETLVSDLRSLDPDLILFSGDMVIREKDDYQSVLDLVSELSRLAPCYGVLGNHESERIYYGGDKGLVKAFEGAGLRLLRNAKEDIRIGEDTVQLIGVEGTSYGFEEYGGRKFMDGTDIDPASFSIVMAHIPILFDKQLSEYDFDLGIAGHVHGGVIVLPFIGGLYTREEGFFPRFTAGEYTLDKQQTLIISAGLGDSKVFPPRINNMPELVVIDIDRD